jgi:outer membrane protein insertion porin family
VVARRRVRDNEPFSGWGRQGPSQQRLFDLAGRERRRRAAEATTMHMTVRRGPALVLGLLLSAAMPADAQSAGAPAPPAAAAAQTPTDPVEPCGPPVKQPPPNSPPLVNCVELRAHPVNETMVPLETYQYYIRMPLTRPSQDQWARYDEAAILADFRNLWGTGFLENLWVQVVDEPFANGVDGKHVVFHIEERNRVKAVDYVPVGPNARLRVQPSKIDEALAERDIQISLDSFVDESTIRQVAAVLRDLYAQEGYSDAQVEHTLRAVAGGVKLVDLRFLITEGPRVRIREIVFDGNEALSDRELRRRMKENKSPSQILFWSEGTAFREEKFADDAEAISEYYKNHGYASVQVGAPQLETLDTSDDGLTRWVRLRVPVEEGQQYRVGNIEITGNNAFRTEGIRTLITLQEGDIFSLETLRKNFEKMKEMYGAFGYYQWTPDAELRPRGIDLETGKPIGPEEPPPIMDLHVKMNEGKQFFVNRITFVGNHTTHDSVIRRELQVAEGAVFNGEALKGSIRRLNQLGYFKPLEGREGEMDVTPTPGTDDKVDITLKVEEQNRNQLAFGAGMSQFEGVFGQLSYQTTNFLGRGETASIYLQKGALAQQYRLAFSEPYLLDRPITVGIDLHSTQFNYPNTFTQRSTGTSTVLGLPLADYTRLYLGYSYEQISISDVNPIYRSNEVLSTNPYLAESLLTNQGGRRRVSKITPRITFNTVNQPLYPTAGQRYSLGVGLAGIGGNTNYTELDVEGIWYFPIKGPMSLGLRAMGQYTRPYGSTTSLPIFEKIFLGGEYNIRGYDIRTVSPRDPRSGIVIGGNKAIVFNAEYYIDVGQVRFLAFYDAGQVRDVGQRFVWKEPVAELVLPEPPPLRNFDLVNPDFILLPSCTGQPDCVGGIHARIVGSASATKTSTGLEARFMVPVLNIPFRLIMAYNPQRFGVLDHSGQPAKRLTFRFAVGTTF